MNDEKKVTDIKVTVNGLDTVMTLMESLGVLMKGVKAMGEYLAKACDDVNVIIEDQQEADTQVNDPKTDDEANPVDFKLLGDLLKENPCMTFGEAIGMLEMHHIPMTDAVRRLGVCCGVLTE